MKNKQPRTIIKPVDDSKVGTSWTKQLSSDYTVADITRILGFKPNCEDDTSKVKYSWLFTVNGNLCGIWDYKGSRWSAYDPDNMLNELFSVIKVD